MKMTISWSLTALNIALALLFLAFAGLSLKSTQNVNEAASEVSHISLPAIQAAGDMQYDFSQLRAMMTLHVFLPSEEEMHKVEGEIAAFRSKLTADHAAYEALISSDRERDVWMRLGRSIANYEMMIDPLIELSRANHDEEATGLLYGDLRVKTDAVFEHLKTLVKFNREGAIASQAAAERTYGSAMRMSGVLVLVVLAITILSLVYVRRQIARPLTEITAAISDLAAGLLDRTIPHLDRTNELGTMAKAVEVLRQSGLAKVELEREAEESVNRQRETERQVREREAHEAEELRIATTALGEGLRRLAAGDVSFRIAEPVAPEYESLKQDFNDSVAQLSATLSSVIVAVQSIDGGIQEISDGTSDLSRRTERQAAALEETASALEEITVNIKSSSDRSSEARSIASVANSSAVASSVVVANAEDAMRRIEESAQQISNIIGVIDEIAFQTNLLALNAGVEAARAGEAGKGFAVVAQEVRELAQRSASAAKDIKGLINASTAEVGSGVKLVKETAVALTVIGGHVSEIHGLLESISTASREQSVALVEINQAVNHMDQTTQQNAAMVEETTAASGALSQEAARLRTIVDRFNPGTAGSASFRDGDRRAA